MGGGGVAGALANGYAQNDSTMTISDCSFTDNQAWAARAVSVAAL